MNRKGMSLIEVMVAIAILSVGTLALFISIDSLNKIAQRQKTKMAALRLNVTLTDLISLPATIRSASSQDNVPGMDLVWKQLRGWAKSDHLGPFLPLPLYLPHVEKVGASFVTGGQISGTPDAPLRYNVQGASCDPSYEVCPADSWPIEVFTEHNFSCPPLFHKGYDDWLRDGYQFEGPIYPDGLAIPAACISKSAVNIRLTIRESVDPGQSPKGLMKPMEEIITLSLSTIRERH